MRLALLVLGLAGMGSLLAATLGLPTVPTGIGLTTPTETDIEILVRSPSAAQLSGAFFAVTWVAWTLWAWLVGTLALRVALRLAEYGAVGAGWLRSVETVSDLLTPTPIRRAVDVSLAGMLLLRVASASPTEIVLAAGVAQAAPIAPEDRPAVPEPDTSPHLEPGDVLYTVQPNDSLGKIAERFYGDWTQYRRIYESNQDVLQPDGRVLQDARKIFPGWKLRIPAPSQGVELLDGEPTYDIEEGDNLSSISARLLGNDRRWRDLWVLNKGATMVDGRAFDDPDLIQPGWTIRLPDGVIATDPPDQVLASAAAGPVPPCVSPDTSQPTSVAVPVEPPTPNPTPSSVPTVAATHTPIAAPTAETLVAAPTAVAVETPPPADGDEESGPERALAAVVLGAAAVSSALLARRIQVNRRRLLHDDPDPADLPYDLSRPARLLAGGFLASDVLQLARQRARGVELNKVTLTCDRLRNAMEDLGVTDARFLLATEAERAILFHLGTPSSERASTLLDPAFAERLEERVGALVRVQRASGTDMILELDHLRSADLVAIGATRGADLWLPIGVTLEGRRLHLNIEAIGHVLVAGMAGLDPSSVIASLAVSAAAAVAPEQLELLMVHSSTAVAPEVDRLPHVTRRINLGEDPDAFAELLADVESEVVSRVTDPQSGQQRHTVIVIDELGAASDQPRLASIIAKGETCGVHLLAGTTGHGDLDPAMLSLISGRLVLRLPDADSSARLLGRPGAEELDGGGDMYVRVLGREPMRVRAFRIEAAELEQCVQLMRDVVTGPAPTTSTAVQEDSRARASSPPADSQIEYESPDESVSTSTGPVAETELTAHPLPLVDDANRSDARPQSVLVAAPASPATTVYHRPLEIRCFGPFTVLRDGEEVRNWERPAAREVLAYLALLGWHGISSDQLLEALVPERDRESAAKILHPRLAFLRKAIREDKEQPFIRFSAGQYRLNPDRVWVDVAAFNDALACAKRLPEKEQEAVLAEAADLYRGELFANDCPEWAVEAQEEYRAKALDALNRSAACAARRGDYRTAVERYRRAVGLDPINEEVVANLARALHQVADRSGILRLRASLTDALRRELDDPDAEPQPETQEVIDTALADLDARRSRG